MKSKITDSAIQAMLGREKKLYVQRNPKSQALSLEASQHWLRGVPMHWMVDWGLPFSLFIEKAKGTSLTDADDHHYSDFCLGDTGAMFGHSPKPVADALVRQAQRGFTTMLPSEDAVWVTQELARRLACRFGNLP